MTAGAIRVPTDPIISTGAELTQASLFCGEEMNAVALRQRNGLRYTLQAFFCFGGGLRIFSWPNDNVLPILEEEGGQGDSLGRSLQSMPGILFLRAGLAGEHLDFIHTDEGIPEIVP